MLERLRREMLDGTLLPGAALRQSELAARYSVSVTPVREALRLLQASGGVTYTPDRGASITTLAPGNLFDVYRIREALEGLATEFCVERADQAVLDRITVAHERIVAQLKAGEMDGLAALNRTLHFAVYEVAPTTLKAQLSSLWDIFGGRGSLWRDRGAAGVLVEDHVALIDALYRRDSPAAVQSMRAHIMRAAKMHLGRDRVQVDDVRADAVDSD